MHNPSLEGTINYTEAGQAHWQGSDKLASLFQQQIASGLHPGAQLVVLHQGQILLEASGGWADRERQVAVGPNTPFLIFSVTKCFTAVCIHHLVEAGRLELDAPVARYWPEFGCNGKEPATLRHVLLHQAGIPMNGMPFQPLLWGFPCLLARQVARMQACWEPGSRMEYHLVNGGFVLGELIRRVTGNTCGEYLQRNFLEPLGMHDSTPGLPPAQRSRAAKIYNHDPAQRNAALVFRLPGIRRLFLPAASLNTTARDLAVFYQMLGNGGRYGGRQYLRPETVAAATALAYDGPNGSSGRRIRWSPGFTLGGYSEWPDRDIRLMGRGSTVRTFGLAGQGGAAIAWADPDSGLVLAFTNNQFQDPEAAQRRCESLADAAWDWYESSKEV